MTVSNSVDSNMLVAPVDSEAKKLNNIPLDNTNNTPQSPSSTASESSSKSSSSSSLNTTTKTTATAIPNNEYDYEGRYSGVLQKEDQDQAVVKTPYGPGLVLRTRRNPATNRVVSRDIELTDWKTMSLASSTATWVSKAKAPKPAMLYSATDFPSVDIEVGSDVLCGPFGRGRVIELLSTTTQQVQQQAKVQLSSWRLAGRSRVICTMRLADLKVVRPKLQYQMNVVERIDHAHVLKQQARTLFVKKEHERALTKYALAVDAVRYVQHDAASTNYVRADLLQIMITCCNNAATCAAQQPANTAAKSHTQNKWDLVLKYANNALVLIQALEDRQNQTQPQNNDSKEEELTTSPTKPSKVYQILMEDDGMTATKLFGEWKGKSLLFIARAHAEKQTYAKAMEACRTAQECVAQWLQAQEGGTSNAKNKVLLQHEKEIQRIQGNCQQRKKAELKKEKQRAQAMFGGSSSSSSTGGMKEKSASTSPTNNSNSSKTTTSSIKTSPAKQPTEKTTGATDTTKTRTFMDDGSKRSVTFEDGGKPRDAYAKPNEEDDDDDEDDDSDTVPWYQEHQELLVVAAGMAVVGLGVTQLVWSKRRR